MKLTLSRGAAFAAAFVAIVARLFLALAVDDGPMHNGAWIAALIGGLMALIYLTAIDALIAGHGRSWGGMARAFHLPMGALALVDSARVLSALSKSASFLAVESTSAIAMVLPVCLAAAWCVCRNGDAVGYGAMLWMRLFPALLLLVVLLQAGHYRPQWLFPLLGNGWGDIRVQSLRSAGWFVPTTAVLLVADDPSDETHRPGRHASTLALAAAVAALLLALRLMMAPTPLRDTGWDQRLDVLLTNGRAPLYLQLPMMLLWYAGLLHLLVCECFSAAALLQRVLPAIDGRLCAALMVAGAGVLSLSPLSDSLRVSGLADWQFVAAALICGLAVVAVRQRKRGVRPCA